MPIYHFYLQRSKAAMFYHNAHINLLFCAAAYLNVKWKTYSNLVIQGRQIWFRNFLMNS